MHPPAAGSRAHVLPGELGEARPFIVDEVLEVVALARFENDDFDALLRELVAERAPARARSYNHDDAVVVLVEFRRHVRFLA